MRFIHTADWHLGRIFHELHLTGDQSYLLDKFIDLVKDAKPDAVVIAGDIYDRAVPPPEAVRLLDDVLSRLCLECGVTVVLISGNHDSPDRLGFASRMLANQNLHIFGSLLPDAKPLTLKDRHGPISLYALPYVEPLVVREKLGMDEVKDHDSAMRAMIALMRQKSSAEGRSVLLTHAFVPGCMESESERPLTVGGAGTVSKSCFEGFSYTALGHLHCPQSAGDDKIQYSGSLMKYSFAESDHDKSVNLVEIDKTGFCSVEQVHLSPRRDVRRIKGCIGEILKGQGSDDYVEVTLLDREPILDAIGKLRSVYPNTLNIRRPCFTPGRGPETNFDHRKMNDTELFSSFFRQVTGDELTCAQRQAFTSVVDALREQEREATA